MKRAIAKRITIALGAAAILVAGTGHAFACSNGMLNGDYAFTITGQILAGPTAGPVSGVAMTHFDGAGNVTQVDYVAHNGVLPAEEWRPATGTYTVNGDCTGTYQLIFTDGSPAINAHFVLGKLGREIQSVVSNKGTAIMGKGMKVESPD